MAKSTVTDVNQLPLMLKSKDMVALLGIDIRTLKQFLAENPACPHIRVGARGQYLSPRDAFLNWLNMFATQTA